MSLIQINLTVTNLQTNVALPGAVVTVYRTGTTAKAAVYDLSGSPISNPLTADSTGLAQFQLTAGAVYDLVWSSGLYVSPRYAVGVETAGVINYLENSPTFLALESTVATQGDEISANATTQGNEISANAAAIAVLQSIAGSGAMIYATLAAANADLAHAAGTPAWVVADSTPSNNGIYAKVGSSGSGSWTYELPLPPSMAYVDQSVLASVAYAKQADAAAANNALPSGLPGAPALLSSYVSGFAIDATVSKCATAQEIIDLVTPANNFLGGLDAGNGVFPAAQWAQAKLCVQSDGSLKYAKHNLFRYSEDLTQAYWTATSATVTGSQTGPDGVTTNGNLLAATSTTAIITEGSSTEVGYWNYVEFVVKAGTANKAYLHVSDGTVRNCWFDMAMKAVGTQGSGLTGYVFTADASGNPYAPGWFAIGITFKAASATPTVGLGVSDADNSTSITSGKTIYASRAKNHWGVKRLSYLKTATLALNGAPYDWTHGSQALLIEGTACTYNSLWSDDLTQSAWTKTNATAALDSTGPHGEPCSSVTATASSATALQAITSATAAQTFSVWLRRRTGTGQVQITVDGGTTNLDVTSSISSKWRQFQIYKAAANPTVGVMLATSGDVVEVALALCSPFGFASSPIPVYGTALNRTADGGSPVANFQTSSINSMFFDGWVTSDLTGAQRIICGLLGTGGPSYVIAKSKYFVSDDYPDLAAGKAGRTAVVSPFGGQNLMDFTGKNPRVQISARFQNVSNAISVNGGPAQYDASANGLTTVTNIDLAEAPVWMRQFVVLPIGLDEATLTGWNLDKSLRDPQLLAAGFVQRYGLSPDSHPQANCFGSMSACKLYETDAAVGYATLAGPCSTVEAGTYEYPNRIVYQTWEFNKSTYAVTTSSPQQVLAQPTNYGISAVGEMTGLLLKVQKGPHAGRVYLVYIWNDTKPATNNVYSVYEIHSDQNGLAGTWSSPRLLFGVSDVGGVAGASSGPVLGFNSAQVAAGVNGWRLATSVWAIGPLWLSLMYSDDGGDTWTLGANAASQQPGGSSWDENSIAARPDGSIVMIVRDDGPSPNQEGWLLAAAGSTSLVYQGLLPGSYGAGVQNNGQCITSTDPSVGLGGVYGRNVVSMTGRGNTGRVNMTIADATDSASTFGSITPEWYPVGSGRYVGYQHISWLYGNVYLLLFNTGLGAYGGDKFNDSLSYIVARF
jgi:hypothetical protein